MESEDVVKEETGSLWRGDSACGWDEVGKFGEPIYNSKNGIMSSSSLRETGDEVHRNGFPRAGRDGETVKKTIRFVCG
jgi:hypothetical protein